jgi:hypothetical protein
MKDAWVLAEKRYPGLAFSDERFNMGLPLLSRGEVAGLLVAVDKKRRLVHVSFCVPHLGLRRAEFVAELCKNRLSRHLSSFDLRVQGLPWTPPAFWDSVHRGRFVGPVLSLELGPALIVRTDVLHQPETEIVQAFGTFNRRVLIVSDKKLHKTVFISYGGLDEKFARAINESLKEVGVRTWFFPDDSIPGQKLHRLMHDGVNSHDRVLLICSESSLSRRGVLNELERVLELEAREGGEDILIPVTIDDYVFKKWKPSRPDIALQVQTRVITTIPTPEVDPEGFLREMERLKLALKNDV